MSLFEDYQGWKQKKEAADSERIKKHDETQEREAKQIESLVLNAGGSGFRTNNYWFKFILGGRYYGFVNQTSRICVTVYDDGLDSNYKAMIGDRWLLPPELKERLDKEIGYEDFIITGDAILAVRKLLSGYRPMPREGE